MAKAKSKSVLNVDWSSVTVTLSAKGMEPRSFPIEQARRIMNRPDNNRPGGWKHTGDSESKIKAYEDSLAEDSESPEEETVPSSNDGAESGP